LRGKSFAKQEEQVLSRAAVHCLSALRMTQLHFICDDHKGPQHARPIARHPGRSDAVARQMIWNESEVEPLGDPVIDKHIFAAMDSGVA
jgi:hypothetical protein